MTGGACAWGVMRLCRDVALVVALAILSKPVVQNLASPNQVGRAKPASLTEMWAPRPCVVYAENQNRSS
jgi:hypothetical protein